MKRVLIICFMLLIAFTMIGCNNESEKEKGERELLNTKLYDEDLNEMQENTKFNFDEILLKKNVSLEDIIKIYYQTRIYSSKLIVYEEKEAISSVVGMLEGSYIETSEEDMFKEVSFSELTVTQIVFENNNIMTVYGYVKKIDSTENKIAIKNYIKFNEKFYESV